MEKILQGEIGKEILLSSFEGIDNALLNSPGGDLYSGFSMYDLNVSTNIDIGVVGVCGSAATIALLGSETRWGTPNSRYLIHNPSGTVKGQAKDFEEKAQKLKDERSKILDIYEKHLNGTREEISAWMDEEIIWSAELAKERGLIKEIKNINQESEQPEGSDIKNLFTNFKMQIDMQEKDKEKLSGIESKLDKLAASIKSLFSPKNVMVSDTNGNELEFPEAETEEQIATGQPVNVNGEPGQTNDYVKQDGTTYVVTDGVLTEIIEPAEEGNEEMEALKAENERLTAELAEVQNSLTTVEGERDEIKNSLTEVNNQFETVQNDFTEFKNKFSDEKPKVNVPENKKEEKKKSTSFNSDKLKSQ